MEVLEPTAGLIDGSAEQARLQRRMDKATDDLKKVGGKLSNTAELCV